MATLDDSSSVYSAPPRASVSAKPTYDSVPNSKRKASSARHSRRKSSARAGRRKTEDGVWRIEPAEIALGKKLGEGSFGVVYRGSWHGTRVAVKQVKLEAIEAGRYAHSSQQPLLSKANAHFGRSAKGAAARAEFEAELQLMASLQNHTNVLGFYGATTLRNGDLAVVVEYCARGALVDALYGENIIRFEWFGVG